MNLKEILCKCPKCGEQFAIGDALEQQAIEQVRAELAALNDDETQNLIEAEINGQVIDIKSSIEANLVILLNDDLINMNEKIIVNYQYTELFNGYVSRSKKVIEHSMKEYGDPYGIYYGEIYLSLAN